MRELENILERALTLSTAGIDRARARQAARRPSRRLRRADGRAPTGDCRRNDGGRSAAALGDQLEDIERDAIIKALEQTRYNKTAAAKLLGMTFRALRYRIKKLGIEYDVAPQQLTFCVTFLTHDSSRVVVSPRQIKSNAICRYA